MASKKQPQQTKYCRIFQWVEAQDPGFATAIRDLCLEGALSPGRSGVTFLYPEDDAYRKEITTKAYTDEADEASNMIQALIIPTPLLTGADFNKGPISNLMNIKLTVESAASNKVKLAGGIELTPVKNFQTLAKRATDIAIWGVSKGKLPVSGEAFKMAPARRGATKGGARATGGSESLGARQVLATQVEGEFDQCMARDRCASRNPYLAKVVSLLNFLKSHAPASLAVAQAVLDYDPIISFYLILEPYKTQGTFLIPDSVLFGEGAWNGAEIFSDAVAEYKAFFGGKTVRERGAVTAQVDAVRQQISGQSNPRQLPSLVHSAYDSMISQNAINGLGPILPKEAVGLIGANMKLWQDEFRFIIHEALQSMRREPQYSTDTFAAIVRDLRTAWPGNNYESETVLSNVAAMKNNVAPRAELFLLMKFINSTDFLYVPIASEIVGGAWGDPDDPNDTRIYNRNAAAVSNLSRVQGMSHPAGISPQALEEIRFYVQAHGQLPPAIQGLVQASQ